MKALLETLKQLVLLPGMLFAHVQSAEAFMVDARRRLARLEELREGDHTDLELIKLRLERRTRGR